MKKTQGSYDETTSDSSRQLRLLRSFGGRITKSPGAISVLSNGLPYFSKRKILNLNKKTSRQKSRSLKKIKKNEILRFLLVTNNDTAPHSVTRGFGPNDPNSAKGVRHRCSYSREID
jgi:hypothetical protein